MNSNKKRFDDNLKRVESMCSIYELLKNSQCSDKNVDYKYTDILRSAVVFLHSSFEDYYRDVIIKKIIENGSRELLDGMGLPDDSKNKKIVLKDLLKYRNLTVEDLIENSVNSYMSEKSFNDYSDICNWAKRIGLDMSKYSKGSTISAAIERRHRIVHEADLRTDKMSLRLIKKETLEKWINAYVELVDIIDIQIN